MNPPCKRLQSLLLIFSVGSYSVWGCKSVPESPLYHASGQHFDFDYESEASFEDYVSRSTDYIVLSRVFLSTDSVERTVELERVKPFRQPLPKRCGATVPNGVLLLHGILDTPFAMRDIAAALAERCIASRAILLPGHGTRPYDLAHVRWPEWSAAADFGFRSLLREHARVSIIGFSLGGLIGLHTASRRPDVHRVIALSPALNVSYPHLIWHTQWLRYFVDWLDKDPFRVSVRYPSSSTNGIAEVYRLSREVRKLIADKQLRTPTLIIQSQDEISIDPSENRNFMSKNMPFPHRLIEYGSSSGAESLPNGVVRESYFPNEKVFNFSHVTLPYHSLNPIFGAHGTHKECGEHIGIVKVDEARKCTANASNWKGEVGSSAPDAFRPVQRLTYNPDFDQMINDMVEWVEK